MQSRLSLALLLAVASVAVAQTTTQPVADVAGVAVTRTERDEIADVLAFEQIFVVAAYERDGHRDPRWDADAMKLLNAQIRATRSDRTDRFYKLPDVMPAAERAELASRVIAAGCDDAMVLYQAGCALKADAEAKRDADRGAAAVTVSVATSGRSVRGSSSARAFAAAARVANASKYAPIYKFVIARAALDGGVLVANPDEAAAAQALLEVSLKETFTDKQTLPKHRLAVWIIGREAFSPKQRDHELSLANGKVIEGLEGGDPWLFNFVMGLIELDRAWVERGGGYANAVTDEGWQGFKRHQIAATERFQAAIEADDTLPQPFSQMVTVAKGESSVTVRAWFEHVVDRQVDFAPAMSNYTQALMPKWGGTHLAMFEEGIRAVDTARFDTRRPAMLLDLLKAIDDEEPLNARQLARVYPQVVRCLDGYIEMSPSEEVKRWARSTRAAWAVRAERWEEASAQFAALSAAGQAVETSAFYEFNLRVAEATSEAAARGGVHAKEIAAALAKPVVERPIALAAVAKSLSPDDVARPWLNQRLADAQLAAALASGDWAPLPIPAGLDGWITEGQAKWTLEPDGSLVCGPYDGPAQPAARPAPRVTSTMPAAERAAAVEAAQAAMREMRERGRHVPPSLVAPFEMPAAFELRFTVRSLSSEPNERDVVGVAPIGMKTSARGFGSPLGWVSLSLARGRGHISGANGGEFPLQAVDGAISLTLRVQNDAISVIGADGQPILETGAREGVIRDAAGRAEGTIEMGAGGLIIRDANGRLLTMPGPAGGVLGAPTAPGDRGARSRLLRFGSPSPMQSSGWRFSGIEIRRLDAEQK